MLQFDVTSDLLPPVGLKNGAKLMKDLVSAVKKNPFAAAAAEADVNGQSSTEEIITTISKPFITAIVSLMQNSAAEIVAHSDSPSEGHDNGDKLAVCVFATNCLITLKTAANQAISGDLNPSASSQFGDDFFKEEIDRVVDRLASCMAASALKLSGLQPLVNRLSEDANAVFDDSTIQLSLNTFENLLNSGADLLTSLPIRQLMIPPALSDQVRSVARERFMAKYELLCNNPKMKEFSQLKEPERIRTLIV